MRRGGANDEGMKISVVTVCFNSAATIASALESFLRQNHSDKELIIIDGASSDDTLSIVRSFGGDDLVVISEPDSGLYEAMNKGLANYSGDAVGFLNSDDRFKDSDALSQIADALEDADIVHGNIDFVADHEGGRLVRRWQGEPYTRRAFANGWMPPHPTFYTRRRVVDAVGRFDLRYRIAADYDFMLRAMELHDFRAAFVDRVLVDMMHGGASTSGVKAYLKSNFEALHSRRRWLSVPRIDKAFIVKPLRKLTQFMVR